MNILAFPVKNYMFMSSHNSYLCIYLFKLKFSRTEYKRYNMCMNVNFKMCNNITLVVVGNPLNDVHIRN